jgi:hypothetical protein
MVTMIECDLNNNNVSDYDRQALAVYCRGESIYRYVTIFTYPAIHDTDASRYFNTGLRCG